LILIIIAIERKLYMDWLKRMNGAIGYIEDNLTGEIDYNAAAKIACCSVHHFQRMFSFIVDAPISEYIRRRRLTLAAFELQGSNAKVIDIALKYGYQSPDAFSRAFYNLHGVTPTEARDKEVLLKVYPRISFHISIQGNAEINYRIVEKEAFVIFGVSEIVSSIDGKCYEQIPSFWNESMENGTMDAILREAGSNLPADTKGDIYGNEEMLINAAIYGYNNEGTFRYMVCQKTAETKVAAEFERLDIPALTWVVFPTDAHTMEETTNKVQALWKRITSEWFPTSSYEHAEAPGLEMYYRDGENKYITEIWIPIIKNSI
jgi:AraC family transcriptional regulator